MSGEPTEYERLVIERVNTHLRAHPTPYDDFTSLVRRVELEVEAELTRGDEQCH
jgi:hypothetical protein